MATIDAYGVTIIDLHASNFLNSGFEVSAVFNAFNYFFHPFSSLILCFCEHSKALRFSRKI